MEMPAGLTQSAFSELIGCRLQRLEEGVAEVALTLEPHRARKLIDGRGRRGKGFFGAGYVNAGQRQRHGKRARCGPDGSR